MSTLFFKRFLRSPLQVASIVPSSRALINRVSSKFDFSKPRVIAEFGPGEGCHTREIVKRMHPDSKLLLFELDAELADHLRQQFRDDPRIFIINTDAKNLCAELEKHGLTHCDYVVSGIPFSTMDVDKKRELLRGIRDALAPEVGSAFIIYQVTNELRGHASQFFPRIEAEYCLQNIPPMFVVVFHKHALNGNGNGNGNGHVHSNGNGRSSDRLEPVSALHRR